MISDDTIAAIGSAVGPAARMIVRMSGPQSQQIASQITDTTDVGAHPVRLRFCNLQCRAWIYVFNAPRSYTGQDTIEFHIPGNPLLARMLLDNLIKLGARQADPGEFTARAYFNGRIDLSQAEGVAAIIAANSESELRAARQLVAGELARRVRPALDSLANALALVEVGIDFSEEDVEFLSKDQIRARIDTIDQVLNDLLRDSARLERLHHTPQFVLVGRPNAGKSTLLNALAGEARAVVSSEAGTTRDALSAEVALSRGVIRLIDVAGVEESHTSGEIERQMQERALAMVETADLVILVRDSNDPLPDLIISRAADLVIHTKADLLPTPSPGTPGEGRGEGSPSRRASTNDMASANPHPNPLPEYRERGPEGILVSAHTGENIPALLQHLDQLAFGEMNASTLAINARHIQAIHDARAALARARERLDEGGAELLAVDLRDALDALGAILGQITPDDVLGRIFSTFCIGK